MSTKKDDKPKKRSRRIPDGISNAVKERHFYECAWDGTRLMDQHHIEEFHLGGEHTLENLILLCPNCHRQVHRGAIRLEELRERQVTHDRRDRIASTFNSDTQTPIIKLGGATFINTPILVQINDLPIISYRVDEFNDILLSARLYNQEGELVFWMSDNRFWVPNDFIITQADKSIKINHKADPYNSLEIWQSNEVIHVKGMTYILGMPIVLHQTGLTFGRRKMIGISVNNGPVGILYETGPTKMNRCGIESGVIQEFWPSCASGRILLGKFNYEDTLIRFIGTADGRYEIQACRDGFCLPTYTSQVLSIAPNCRFNIDIQVYPQWIDFYINGDYIAHANDTIKVYQVVDIPVLE